MYRLFFTLIEELANGNEEDDGEEVEEGEDESRTEGTGKSNAAIAWFSNIRTVIEYTNYNYEQVLDMPYVLFRNILRYEEWKAKKQMEQIKKFQSKHK